MATLDLPVVGTTAGPLGAQKVLDALGVLNTKKVECVIVLTGSEARPAEADVVIWIDPDELGAPNSTPTDLIATPGGTSVGGTTGDVQLVVSLNSPIVIYAANSNFAAYRLDTVVTNIGGGSFDTSTYIYTVPEDGLYLCVGGIRLGDGDARRSVAVGIGTANADGPAVLWDGLGGSAPNQRAGRQYTRVTRFNAGDQVRMFIYSDGFDFGQAGSGHGSYMSITKLAD